MYDPVTATVGVNFRFYRRNRLLIAASLLILFVAGLSTVPALFFIDNSRHLARIMVISTELCALAFFLAVFGWLIEAVYLLLPMTNPVADKTAGVFKSLRGEAADWLLPAAWGYVLGISLFFFLLSNHILKKKRLM